MGVSVTPKIVIGVKSSVLVKSEFDDDEFEIHDERGNPTGRFKTETTKIIYLANNPKKRVKDEGYVDTVSDLLDVVESPYNGKFGFHPSAYETNDYLETGIVGICISDLDNVMYGNGLNIFESSEIVEVITQVKTRIKEKYGVDVSPKLYHFALVG